MRKTVAIAVAALLAAGSSAVLAGPKAGKAICLSSGPLDNIAESGYENGEEVPVKLAYRFVTVNLLNNGSKPVKFEAQFYQIDGLGDWEGGTWPKPKVLLSSGTREPVAPGGSDFLNTDIGDDTEPVYGVEAQVKITGKVKRSELLVSGHARADERLKIVPELRLLNTEWTEIPCTW